MPEINAPIYDLVNPTRVHPCLNAVLCTEGWENLNEDAAVAIAMRADRSGEPESEIRNAYRVLRVWHGLPITVSPRTLDRLRARMIPDQIRNDILMVVGNHASGGRVMPIDLIERTFLRRHGRLLPRLRALARLGLLVEMRVPGVFSPELTMPAFGVARA